MASNTGKTPSASSSKAPAKKPAAKQTKEAPLPNMMTCGHCRLEYQVHVPGQDPSTKYQAMDSLSKMRDLQIAFYSGQITVSQKKEGNWCERTFLREDYTWESFEVPEKQPPANRFLHINVHLQAGSPAPPPTFKTKPSANAQETERGIEQAKGFPLANLPTNVFRLRLFLAEAGQVWTLSKGAKLELKLETRGRQIQRLLTGAVSVDPTTRVAKELGTDRALMKLESTKDEEQLGSLKNCRIEVSHVPGRTNLDQAVVQIWPKPKEDDGSTDREYNVDKKVGESYTMLAPKTFKVDPPPPAGQEIAKEASVMKNHQIYGDGAFTWLWKITLVKNKMGLGAPLVGLVQNAFDDSEGNRAYIGKREDNVDFEPDFIDVLRDRAQESNWNTADLLDFEAMLDKGFDVDLKTIRSELPIERFFMMERCNDRENQLDKMANVTLPMPLQQDLNEWQQKAILTGLKNKFSLIWGPPGTGKSKTLASLIMYLTRHQKPEKTLVCASTNVAVDEALAKAFLALKNYKAAKGEKLPFMRVYSPRTIRTQYAEKNPALLSSFHIEQVCTALAKELGGEFTPFVEWAAEAKATGLVKGKKNWEEYDKLRTRLARIAMDNFVHVVFCTLSMAGGPLLYQWDHETEDRFKPKWMFHATTIIVDERSTVIRPYIMIAVVVFFDVVRVIQAGDDRQLGPYLVTEAARTHFHESSFTKLREKGWPCTVLLEQYRTYKELFGHTLRAIYPDQPITSARSLHDGRTPFGDRLAAALPLTFSNGLSDYKVPAVLHLFDVEGVQVPEGTSAKNMAEVMAIHNLVLAFKSAGCKLGDIAVLAGYAAQTRALARQAHQGGWSEVRILTIDSSQGGEAKTLIISLVTTKGQPTFMGNSNRANVATSRAQEAMYFVGNWSFWRKPVKGKGSSAMSNILHDCYWHAHEVSKHDFVQGPVGKPKPLPAPNPPTTTSAAAPQPAQGAQQGKALTTPSASTPASPQGPASPPPPPARLAPRAAPAGASAGPSIPERRDDAEEFNLDRLVAERMQADWNAEEDPPAEEQAKEESDEEVEGKGKGKAAVIPPEGSQVEEPSEVESLMAQLTNLENERQERHRQIMDQANVNTTLVDIEIDERKKELNERLDRLFRGA